MQAKKNAPEGVFNRLSRNQSIAGRKNDLRGCWAALRTNLVCRCPPRAASRPSARHAAPCGRAYTGPLLPAFHRLCSAPAMLSRRAVFAAVSSGGNSSSPPGAKVRFSRSVSSRRTSAALLSHFVKIDFCEEVPPGRGARSGDTLRRLRAESLLQRGLRHLRAARGCQDCAACGRRYLVARHTGGQGGTSPPSPIA